MAKMENAQRKERKVLQIGPFQSHPKQSSQFQKSSESLGASRGNSETFTAG